MRYATAAALRAGPRSATRHRSRYLRDRRRMAPSAVTLERLLAQFALADGERWVLEGGMAVEVRMSERARTTKDNDLAA